MLETHTATTADAGLIASHRRAMFATMGGFPDSTLDLMCRSSEPWIGRMVAAGKYLGWIASDGDRPVASAGLLILDWTPHPLDPTGEHRGYVLNVFVEPQYRKRGLARSLVQRCLDEARRRGIRVISLHASDVGRPLYERLGFRSSSEMIYEEREGDGATV
jgi:ribosomal protein S18 acetylase RimI-like enzyme